MPNKNVQFEDQIGAVVGAEALRWQNKGDAS
jgi:hypothetical protein